MVWCMASGWFEQTICTNSWENSSLPRLSTKIVNEIKNICFYHSYHRAVVWYPLYTWFFNQQPGSYGEPRFKTYLNYKNNYRFSVFRYLHLACCSWLALTCYKITNKYSVRLLHSQVARRGLDNCRWTDKHLMKSRPVINPKWRKTLRDIVWKYYVNREIRIEKDLKLKSHQGQMSRVKCDRINFQLAEQTMSINFVIHSRKFLIA